MTLDQKRARAFGVLYLITFVTSISAALLYQPVLDHPVAYIAGAGHDDQIILGALLELLLIIANIGTAVVIFPIVRRQDEVLALGYVTARLFECTFHSRRHPLGSRDRHVAARGCRSSRTHSRVHASRDQGLDVPARAGLGRRLGKGLILGYLMYRSVAVPRPMAWLGLVGGPLIIASGTAVMFGVDHPGGPLQGLATIPEFLWELSLGVYCTFKRFRPSSAILQPDAREGRAATMPTAPA